MMRGKISALCLLARFLSYQWALAQGPVFPTTVWEARMPDEVGLNPEKLDQFKKKSGNDVGIVIKDGYVVYSWGDISKKFDWASASKAVVSTMLFFALQEGRLATVDGLIEERGWPLSPTDRTITFRHLANMVSGYGLPEEPGTHWAYNDYAIALYNVMLFDRVFDEGSPDAVARHPARLGALQFEDGSIFGPDREGFGLRTSPRDFARIGWFWLNRGNWDGTELLDESYFDLFQPQVASGLPRTAGGQVNDYLKVGTQEGGADQTQLGPGVYGFNLWHNPNRKTWPSAPADTYQANGHWNGEVLTVFPSLNMVVAWKGKRADPSSFVGPMDGLLKLLVEATQ
jgi:CubicO group peptidase (beta-lactamase class C family)